MANYLFENMSDTDAATFDHPTNGDELFFLTGSPSSIGVTVNPASGFTNASITLSNGNISHTFNANGLNGEVPTFFNSNSADTLGFGGNNTNDTVTVTGSINHGARYYALGGNDVITGSAASDTIDAGTGNDTITNTGSLNSETDFLYGGAGNDTISGGNSNEHIYGNNILNTNAGDDGADSIVAGGGSDYVQGNLGNDTIDGGEGSDRLYGGNGADSIVGGNGNDYLQGNKGADVLDGQEGNDTVRGGADNDSVSGGNGDDHLSGDNGDDTVRGGLGVDDLTGGNGADTFQFQGTGAANEASDSNLTTATTATSHDAIDFINDFVHGTDKLQLQFTATAVDLPNTGTAATTADGALVIGQQTLDNDTTHGGHEVAAVQVGSDTYLFWVASGTDGGTVDSAVLLKGVTASTLTISDFI